MCFDATACDCGIERLHGEWLVLMCRDATDVCLERVLVDERLHAELLVLICCDASGIRFFQPLGRGRVGGRAVLA